MILLRRGSCILFLGDSVSYNFSLFVIQGDFSYRLSIMTYKGVVRGKTIHEEHLSYPEGQPVSVSVEPPEEKPQLDLPSVIRQIMHEPPHLRWEDVDELERAIGEGKLPVYQGGVFD